MDLRLRPSEAARQLGVPASSYSNWEAGHYRPGKARWALIVAWMGFDPGLGLGWARNAEQGPKQTRGGLQP